MLTGGMVGAPLIETEVPCASIVVPCGIEAMRNSAAERSLCGKMLGQVNRVAITGELRKPDYVV